VHSTSTVIHRLATSTSIAAAHTTPAAVWKGAYEQKAAGPMTHTVIVGGDALVYNPSEIKAAVGDSVLFVFHKQNHTVTESTFAKPCNKKEGTTFDSGFVPNPNNTITPAPTYLYTVTSLEPSWWYCKQRTGSHCGKGMVFAINPTPERTFAKFKEVAIQLNGTASATPAAPAASTATAVASTVTLDAGAGNPTASTTASSAPALLTATATGPGGAMVTGWNQNAGANGACQCACFCGSGSFGPGQGIGAFGGKPGSLPAPW